jgi:hypothetical protein
VLAIRTGSQRRPKRLNKARHLCDKSDWHRYRKLGSKKIEEALGLGPSMTQAMHHEDDKPQSVSELYGVIQKF